MMLDTWQAQLQLYFTQRVTRTVLSQRRHSGPLQIQRPFYPETNGTCHVYLLHPPGGIVGGDHLQIQIHVDKNAQALITTPAATKLYAHPTHFSQQNIQLTVAQQGILEWLPQETIAFNDSRSHSQLRVMLAPDSVFMGWDIVCLGRPASHERFMQGQLRQAIEIYVGKTPLWIERAYYQGDSPLLSSAWGLAGYPVVGSFLCAVPTITTWAMDELRETLHNWFTEPSCLCALTSVEGMLISRYLGNHAEQAKAFFTDVWTAIRPSISQRPACPPRIWAT
ncbi:urease accessory protein UreD [Beggiatoa leptomitoformis]|uniref:Urease accessory protein UreD n=1 Tax=Beggiatoa leptomitoformis TaxID=288004 RepID=A0A650GD52_9GAMM|nr:urease accessory protein UreD [Beggiatoa leptomitoformis]ALG67647.1 urease accessory protein [Beggiatoa leptomitoformis]QGX04073.1 urease accessory protein [Beggiatoa leptomitoformis]